MKTNPKAILSVIGVAALLASPVMAKTVRHHHASRSIIYIPRDAFGSVGYYAHGALEGGPYTPSMPTPPHGKSHDFQDEPR